MKNLLSTLSHYKVRWLVCVSASMKAVSNICHQKVFTKALKCLQNSELSVCFCMNFWNEDTEWDKVEFCYNYLFIYVKNYESEGSALGFMFTSKAHVLVVLSWISEWFHHWVWLHHSTRCVSPGMYLILQLQCFALVNDTEMGN